MLVVTLINRLRSVQSLLQLMTSVVMGNKMEGCNSLLLGLCREEAVVAVVTSQPDFRNEARCKAFDGNRPKV